MRNIIRQRISKGHVAEAGITPIDALLNLIITLVVLVVGYGIYMVAKGNSDSSKAMQEVITLSNGIRSMYSSTNTFTGITAAGLISGGAVPSTMIQGTTIVPSWTTGAVTVAATAASPCHGTSCFQLTFPKMDNGVCMQLASGMVRQSDGVVANGTYIATPSAAATACNRGNGDNTLVITAR